MSAPKATTQQSQDAEIRPNRNPPQNLDHRYGKIGISAVAAAIRHRPQPNRGQQATPGRGFSYDHD
jgi:hypothetical protein